MKLLKPSWVHHDEKPIFSVDVHQECLKFATGGQGNDSGRVVIWNLLPVLSEKVELDDTVPKMLCQMDNHLSCVNCVRWSQSGLMLASGSDDKLVMIWRQSKGPSGVFGTGGIKKNPESWKCAFTLRGHSGDVLDLAWSPQDRWLASCSIDNTTIVWDVQNFPVMVAMLKGHTGLVKGVAWDPVGKFLASQSDDRSVKIWKTSDWSCNSTIKEPFEECGGTTHVLRLSWSPDGQYLVSAHAMNGGGPTAQIIEREGWKCDKDFVGHRKAVTCVRFHTAILKRQMSKNQKPQQYCCLAVGSRDRSLSVWMTALQRPLVVIHDLFSDSILDLSWGPEKCILMACSGDGTVACLQFSETELGTPLSEEDKNALYQRIYGKSVNILGNGTATGIDMLIENAELLHCVQKKIEPPALPTSALLSHIGTTTTAGTYNIAESRNNALPSMDEMVLNKDKMSSNNSNSNCDNNNESLNVLSNGIKSKKTTPIKATRGTQLETRTADGKRRITPVFIPLDQSCTVPANPTELNSSCTVSTNIATSTANGSVNIRDNLSNAITSVTSQDLTVKAANITEHDQERLDSRLVKCKLTRTLVQPLMVSQDAFHQFPFFKQTPAPPSEMSPAGLYSTSKVFQASTSGPKMPITPTTKCEFQKTVLDYRIHVNNGCVNTANGFLAKITAYRLSKGKLWDTLVGSPVVNFNFCTKCVVLCSLDGSLRFLDLKSGLLIMPIVSLTTAAVQCAFCPKGQLVGVITECGLLRVWNIETCRAVLAATCSDVFGKNGAIVQFTLTEHGIPLIVFANGHAYSYSPELMSWLVLSSKDPLMRHGLQSSLPKEFNKNHLLFPLTSVQVSTITCGAQSAGIDLGAHDWQLQAKIIFIENQIKLCEAINSPDELKYWYSMLAFQLAVGGNENRLRLLLNDLLGTPFTSVTHILNITKHELFEIILNQLKAHIKWQRIYMEYNELYENYKRLLAGANEKEENSVDDKQNNALTAACTSTNKHSNVKPTEDIREKGSKTDGIEEMDLN